MTASKNVNLVSPVADRVAMELCGMSVSDGARMLNTSKPMIARLRAGTLSSVPILLKAIEQFGVRILEPIIGKFDDESLFRRLADIETSQNLLFGEIRHARTPSAHPSLAHRPLGAHGRGGGGIPRLVRTETAPVDTEGAGATLSLVETRRVDGIPGAEGEALRRHLTAFDNVISLDAARALVTGDNLGHTGLAYKHPGEDYKLLVAPQNRLWTPSPDPRPITEYEGNVVQLRRDLDTAARSTSPVYAVHAGALVRDGSLIPFHSAVVRIGGKAKCGAEMVLTDFVRVRA